ncbi:hypothetical protein GUJ93_ZPchr0002g24263 [Zizania palustris]|uniref:Protein kinase domain-containing protein n=1 Tax=Zizania palustris TaxID=103762 RepID=A0A8J5VFV0_ZIZPA|nr:hypothetical protein GUJ93_ZPchr0002g24263 [Zizania palustris]
MAAFPLILTAVVLCSAFASASGFTNPADALGLWELYRTLESPWQLSGWKFGGGDPCGGGGEQGSWHGVFCRDSSIVIINISGLGVGGWLGPQLLKFYSLKALDVSFNNIAGEIPPNLPPNVEYLNFAANKFEGSIPPSLLWLHSLKYLNLSNNKLSGIIGDVFVNMERLGTMDLSFNSFCGDLPTSFSLLKNLHHLYLQHNEFTGSVILLAGLPLSTLNIENNSFSGYVPGTFESIPELRIDGNQFQPVPKANEVLYSWSSLMTGCNTSSSDDIKAERATKRKVWAKTSKNFLPAKQYQAVDILAATRDFSKEYLIGEGFTGQVYRGDFPDGQLLAIKKINMVDLSLSEQDDLIDMLGKMSSLKHPNISALVGYCVEFGHCALLYEYAENGSLDDILFSAATRSRALSWKARMKIALGVAYALEFMHLRCSPPVVHGNIKSTNILLDAQLMPYLSHCGLAKLSRFVSTIRTDLEALSSAKGYAAPETTDPSIDNIKADIYSFGVILLVLLTGQKAFDSSRRQNEQFLVDWASPHLHDFDSLERITDPRIRGSMPSKAISTLGNIILLCIKKSPELRPPMTVITDKLLKLVQSTGLQKTGTTQHSEVDAQEPSFVTTRPYFEPSSTAKAQLEAASPRDKTISSIPPISVLEGIQVSQGSYRFLRFLSDVSFIRRYSVAVQGCSDGIRF